MDVLAALKMGIGGDLKWALIGTGIGLVIVFIRQAAGAGKQKSQADSEEEQPRAAPPTLKARCKRIHEAWLSLEAGSLDADSFQERKVALLKQSVRQAKAEGSGKTLLGYLEHLRQLGAVGDAEFTSVQGALEPKA